MASSTDDTTDVTSLAVASVEYLQLKSEGPLGPGGMPIPSIQTSALLDGTTSSISPADTLTRSSPPSSAGTLATSNGPLSNYPMSNGVVVAASPRRRRKEVCNSELPICSPALASFLLIAAWMGCRSRWENFTREMGCPVRIHPVLRFVSFADSSTAVAWTALL